MDLHGLEIVKGTGAPRVRGLIRSCGSGVKSFCGLEMIRLTVLVSLMIIFFWDAGL
jgi:hypothetical protein